MGVFDRLTGAFRPRPKSRKPAEKHDAGAAAGGQLTMGDAQLKQLAALSRMRRGVADVSVSRQRLDLQAVDLQKAMAALAAQASAATAAGDSGASQTALGRQVIMAEQLADIISQRDALAEQESMLAAELAQLQARVAGFNVTAETLKAAQAAADARQNIASSLKDLQDP
jgi:phage shock protein A